MQPKGLAERRTNCDLLSLASPQSCHSCTITLRALVGVSTTGGWHCLLQETLLVCPLQLEVISPRYCCLRDKHMDTSGRLQVLQTGEILAVRRLMANDDQAQ